MRKDLESCGKLLVLPELLWHTLHVAHPSPESNSAHKLWEEGQGPSLSFRGRGPTVCQPPSEATLTSQSFVNVSDLGTD